MNTPIILLWLHKPPHGLMSVNRGNKIDTPMHGQWRKSPFTQAPTSSV